MRPTTGVDDELVVDSLADALGIGLDLVELLGNDGDYCAAWLGTAEGMMLDCVICTDEHDGEHHGDDIDELVRVVAIGARILGAERAVLWRSVDDVTEPWPLCEAFFDHGSVLAEAGVQLVDEIVIGADQLRSMAVTSFTDEEGWDDVSARLAHEEEDEWPW